MQWRPDHNNPWAAIDVPHVDTSGWMIKRREEAIQDVERVIRELQSVHAELISQIPESRDKNTSIQRSVSGVADRSDASSEGCDGVCQVPVGTWSCFKSGKVSVEHLSGVGTRGETRCGGRCCLMMRRVSVSRIFVTRSGSSN